ncbi:hypothetical protein [Salmonella enterica]|uniref:hypothetical protein n=1 Tax=Salmonella enterica TaxID=28901 RepID=UPI001FF057F7|nr:hypothetical protein [Salmonella enterica]
MVQVAATEGAHEGSLLGAADERLDHSGGGVQPAGAGGYHRQVLAVMGMVCAGFLAFILFSGPFATLPAFPVEGAT